ncbi:MAG: hypothetical protein D6812_17390 [Deltaproteobacteria bacterium]|nr:MAG: hypothetical protein D6812_17390 [Deltaproteobacteria bacterium]
MMREGIQPYAAILVFLLTAGILFVTHLQRREVSPTEGEKNGPRIFPVCRAPGDQRSPALAWGGDHYFAVWADERCGDRKCTDLFGTPIGRNGEVRTPEGLAITQGKAYEGHPAIAWNGESFLVVWEDHRCGHPRCADIYGARLLPDGTVTAERAISQAPNRQAVPQVAWNGKTFLVVWQDGRSGTGSGKADIYGARVDPTGNVLDPEGIPLVTARESQVVPRIAWGRDRFLLVWSSQRRCDDLQCYAGIHGLWLDAEGKPLERLENGFPISPATGGQYVPDVGWDGRSFLVAWDDRLNREKRADIYARRFSPFTPGAIFPISTRPEREIAPAILATPKGFSLFWMVGSRGGEDIYHTEVTPDGVEGGRPFVAAPGRQGALRGVWGERGALLLWEDERGGDADILAAPLW